MRTRYEKKLFSQIRSAYLNQSLQILLCFFQVVKAVLRSVPGYVFDNVTFDKCKLIRFAEGYYIVFPRVWVVCGFGHRSTLLCISCTLVRYQFFNRRID